VRPVPAAEIAKSAQVSLRTVYRDVRRLQEAGVPIVSEPGRSGGLLLAPGYRLAPLALNPGETVALAMAVQMLRTLPALPFRAELETAARKIATAARVGRPELLRDVPSWLRIEPPAADILHPERSGERAPDDAAVGDTVQIFVEALLAGRSVAVDYRSPYRTTADSPMQLDPAGVLADRGLWYLVAFPRHALRGPRYLRADRVRRCTVQAKMDLGRQARWRSDQPRPWLHDAMRHWAQQSPVTLEVDAAQWRRLARDWYFSTGTMQPAAGGLVHFTWGEGEFERVRELVAWLGPPARIVAPLAWVPRMRDALAAHTGLQAGGGE
jgi:predicted DNA-binding transcriptional regulator YafY